MERPSRSRRGRHIDREKRTVSGHYFDLACQLVGISQEEMARKAGVAASTLSRAFSGQQQVKREKLLHWSDIFLDLCPPDAKALLLAMEAEMLHSLGYATRDDQRRGEEQLSYYQQQVNTLLRNRQSPKTS